MILGFKTKLNGEQTRFPEKIIRSFDNPEYRKMTDFDMYNENLREEDILSITEFHDLKPKIHTIREDANDRWKAGSTIQFATGVRTKRYKQFAEGVCVSVQRIEIAYQGFGLIEVYIDGNPISKTWVEQLAINDGFASVEDFFAWFNKDFTGKIIHWTDFRYLERQQK